MHKNSFEKREENKIDHSNEKIVSISLSLGEARGAWKLHPFIIIAQRLFIYLANLALVSKFGFRKIAFCSCQLSVVPYT